MAPRPPAGFIRSLRRACDNASLTVEFDNAHAERTGEPGWKVLYMDGPRKTLVTAWPAPLEGNFWALVERVRENDMRRYRHVKQWASDLLGGIEGAKRRREARRRDDLAHAATEVRRPMARALSA